MGTREPSKPEQFLARNASIALLLLGVALITGALATKPPDATGTALVVMGAAMLIVGCLLPNLEGTLKVGPSGVEAVLRKVNERAIERGLDPDDRALAVGEAYQEVLQLLQELDLLRDGARPAKGSSPISDDPAALDQARSDSFADRIIREFTDMEPVNPAAVPEDAADAVRSTSGHPELTIEEAERRPGRGAPRWHLLMSDDSRWRVSNTVHGWKATPFA